MLKNYGLFFLFLFWGLNGVNAEELHPIDEINPKQESLSKTEERSLIDDTEKRRPVLLDVRSAAEVKAHPIKAAVHIPIEELSQKIYKFKSDFSTDREIHVFCESGRRAESAKSILEKNGYKKVVNRQSWKNI